MLFTSYTLLHKLILINVDGQRLICLLHHHASYIISLNVLSFCKQQHHLLKLAAHLHIVSRTIENKLQIVFFFKYTSKKIIYEQIDHSLVSCLVSFDFSMFL
jgi:hypothetical protein